jgi:D-3-phosphoglycerate dehydrogenase / 2-oxoglutarate reductase
LKVLIADKFEQSGIDGLKAAGCEVVYQPDLKDAALVDAIRDSSAEALVVRGTVVSAGALEAGQLALVVRAGAGYNTIDVAAASRRGIYVSNCPGRNAIAVAELTFALILALDRRVPDNVADLRAGRWNKKEYSKARGLFGRTLGLIGYGSIGAEVAQRAQAFGMSIVVWSRRFTRGQIDAAMPFRVVESPQRLAEISDVVSVHLALTKETRGFVDESILGRMRPGSYFINTARAEVVDGDALTGAARDGGIRVGLDVFRAEPGSATGGFSDPLVALPNVYGTHHIGGSTDQAQEAIAAETVRVVTAYMTTGRVPNVVNLAVKTPATHRLIVRHRDRPGVLAHVFEVLKTGRVNVQETENVIFEGAEAAIARISVDAPPSDSLIAAIRDGNKDILDLRVVTI